VYYVGQQFLMDTIYGRIAPVPAPAEKGVEARGAGWGWTSSGASEGRRWAGASEGDGARLCDSIRAGRGRKKATFSIPYGTWISTGRGGPGMQGAQGEGYKGSADLVSWFVS